MRITYIFHDCFLLESDSCQLLFDYWKIPEDVKLESFINPLKPLYIFVSHFHKDHYNPDIFTFSELACKVRYILDLDVAKRARPYYKKNSIYKGERRIPEDIVSALKPGESYEDDILKISAFGSTDCGCSWLVACNGKYIFHAGDLNAWIWKDESSMEEVNQAITEFESKLKPLLSTTKCIDIAMFPVDSRIGSEYYTGAAIFLKYFSVNLFLPMHFALANNKEEEAKLASDASKFELYAPADKKGEYAFLNKTGASLFFSQIR